jgi:hypothetical protein
MVKCHRNWRRVFERRQPSRGGAGALSVDSTRRQSGQAKWVSFCLFEDDGLVTIRPLLDRVDNLVEFLEMPEDPEHLAALTKGQTIGRPLMDDQKLGELEKQLGRALRQGKRGRPASQKNDPKQRKSV